MNQWIDWFMRKLREREEKKNTLFQETLAQTGKKDRHKTLYQRLVLWRDNDIFRDKDHSGRIFYLRIWSSLGLFVLGVSIALLEDNLLLVLPLGLGLFSIPYLEAAAYEEKRAYHQIEEEEVSLSVLSGQYLSESSFENALLKALPYMEGAVKEDMEWFLQQSRYVNADYEELMDSLIQKAKTKRRDDFLAEWYLELKKTFSDKGAKKDLYDHVEQIGEMRMAKREFQLSAIPLRKEYWVMAALIPGSRWLMMLLNRDWASVLTQTTLGKAVTAVGFCILLVTAHTFYRLITHDDAVKIDKKSYDEEEYKFIRYLRYEIKRSRNLEEILNRYLLVAQEPLKKQLALTVADMKTGNQETALIRLDRRMERQTMSDICRGLGAFLQGEVKEAYWQVIERKIVEERRAKRKEINRQRMEKVKKLGLWLLIGVLGMFLSVMAIQIISQLSQMF